MNTKRISHDKAEDISTLFTGRQIVSAQDDLLTLDDGTQVRLVGSEGCGGCVLGHMTLEQIATHNNIITSAVVVEEELPGTSDDAYRLFVYTDTLATEVATFTGSDNGHYGLGFTLHITKA